MSSERNINSQSKRLDTSLLADRKASFTNNATKWSSSLPSVDSMSEAGFYFTPTDKNLDCVTCFRCGVKMFNWLPDDTPKSEHKKFSSSCKEVKSWNNVVVEEDRVINRADQTDSGLRSKLAGKAKRFTGSLHRKHEKTVDPSPSTIKETTTDDRVLNDEEKLAGVRRQREVAEKALDGLQKLSSFYTIGSLEQKRAEQSIVLQTTELEKLRQEEEELYSKMGNLTFGHWGSSNKSAVASDVQSYADDDESPQVSRTRSQTRPLPVLPSQMRKNSMPRMPTRLQKSFSTESDSNQQSEIPSYEEPSASKTQDSEWVEYFTEAGVPYYYSTITKTTVWQIPTSPESKPVM